MSSEVRNQIRIHCRGHITDSLCTLQVGQSEYQHRSFDDGGPEDEKRRGHSKNSSYSDRDRKIGHRRINEDGLVSYKKIETNTLMGSIQLGIQAAIGGLTKYAERDLLMQDFMTGVDDQ